MRPLLTVGEGGPPYYLREGALEALPELVAELASGAIFVITDGNVGPLWGDGVAAALETCCLQLPAGEEHKRWTSVERSLLWLLSNGVERGDLLVAVGGGVVTDLVGFTASVALRGLDWVAVPTTVMGMVDAAVGGKTGFDLDEGKNLVGTFWQPRAVVADPLVLATLDDRERRAGLVEAVKGAIIAPAGTLGRRLDDHLQALAAGDLSHAGEVVGAAVRVKAEIVAADEREMGPRASLNLGHTLGHALEASTGYRRFLHGEAVAIGLLGALLLARDRGMLDADDLRPWFAALTALGPYPAFDDLDFSDLAPFLTRDKKRRDGRVRWVLPRRGGVVLGNEIDLDAVAAVYAGLARASRSQDWAALV